MVLVPVQVVLILLVEFVGFARKDLPIIVKHHHAVLFAVAAIRGFRTDSVHVLRDIRFLMGFVL